MDEIIRTEEALVSIWGSLFASLLIGHSHRDFVVKSTCASQRRIQRVWPVGSAYHYDWFIVCLVPGEVYATRMSKLRGHCDGGNVPSMQVKNWATMRLSISL